MKKLTVLFLILFVMIFLVGCMAHEYSIGSGPQKGMKVEKRQWYVLWGLVPISNVDIKDMIGAEQNYKVRTAEEPLDVIINIVTGSVTVYSRTVTVTK